MNIRPLGFVPVLRRNARLAKYLSDQAYTDVADMGVRDSDLLGSLDHELMLPA
jgi:hypothetical protein